MLVSPLLDTAPQWVSDAAPEAATAVLCQCSLARNLADFAFPARCTDEEKQRVLDRVVDVLDRLNLLSTGRYYYLPDLSAGEVGFLAERRLITYGLMCAQGPRGVYVSEDQGLSIMLNGSDHLCTRVLLSGLQLPEAWARLYLMDDTLGGALDFAFEERLGFLTASLGNVGTGLKASVVLHLPGLVLQGGIPGIEAELPVHQGVQLVFSGIEAANGGHAAGAMAAGDAETGQSLYSDMAGAICGPVSEAQGDLYLLANRGTLGVSEEEIVFHVGHGAAELVAKEKAARQGLLNESRQGLEDRVGRACGVAGGARLLGFPEGIAVLSSLRLGVERGVLRKQTIRQVNELLLASQKAHLEMAHGRECDALTLSTERAGLFRRVVAGSNN